MSIVDICKQGKFKLLKSLVNKEIINAYIDDLNNTLLHIACNRKLYRNDKNILIVKYLLSIGANINAVNLHNETPLFLASKYRNNANLVQLLLQHLADVNICDKWLIPPLHEACMKNNISIAKLLLPYCNDSSKQLSIENICRFTVNIEILDMLLHDDFITKFDNTVYRRWIIYAIDNSVRNKYHDKFIMIKYLLDELPVNVNDLNGYINLLVRYNLNYEYERKKYANNSIKLLQYLFDRGFQYKIIYKKAGLIQSFSNIKFSNIVHKYVAYCIILLINCTFPLELIIDIFEDMNAISIYQVLYSINYHL